MDSELPNLTTLPEPDEDPAPSVPANDILCLVLLWCRDEPWRIGEVLVAPGPAPEAVSYFGRGSASDGDRPKTHLSQLRPGLRLPGAPLSSATISRYQLRLQTTADAQLLLENIGRAPLLHNQKESQIAPCQPGDLIQIGKQLLFLCVREPAPRRASLAYPEFPFGAADVHGIVGESAESWRLRQQIAFAAARRDPVLVHGGTGSGRELAARAIHALSARHDRLLIASSAAETPDALGELQLFGNSAHYPSTGHPERPGLLAEAHGSSLLIREFERLNVHTQESVLRLIEQGSWQRFGDRKQFDLDVRLLVTCERDPNLLAARVASGFGFNLRVPDLNARRRDIPLLLRHLLRREAERGDELSRSCFPGHDWRAEPMVPLHVLRELLELNYTSHVQELKARLWQALAAEQLGIASDGARRSATQAVPRPATADVEARSSTEPPAQSDAEDVPPAGLDAASVQAALDQNNGVLEATWRALGLKNRFVLLRLIKRYDLEIRKRPALSNGPASRR